MPLMAPPEQVSRFETEGCLVVANVLEPLTPGRVMAGFAARSRRAPQTELRDRQAPRTLWHDARARLSGTALIPIHRWKSDSPVCA
jgi:hypothetical protein